MARTFDGSIERILYGDILDATLFTDYSISVQFRVDAFDTAFQTLFSKGDGSWRIARDSSTNLLNVAAGRFPNQFNVSSSGSVNDGNNHNVIMTWDDSITTIEEFIDGVSEGTDATGIVPIDDAFNVSIADNDEPNNREWEGMVADVIFYSTKLTAGHISGINSGCNPFIVADQFVEFYAPLYGNESPTPDYSGNGNTGTLVSAPPKSNHPNVELLENYV